MSRKGIRLGKIVDVLKNYAGAAANTSIVVVTGGVQQIATFAAYQCPCVEPLQLGQGCNEAVNHSVNLIEDLRCSQPLNVWYGLMFLFAPAFVLFVFSAAVKPRLWKSVTGCCKKSEEYKREVTNICGTVIAILLRSLISPMTWICIALLDGKYLACSCTTLPYRLGGDSDFKNCEEVSAQSGRPYSNAFRINRSRSQLFGGVGIIFLLLVVSLVYCCSQCCSPFTYFHAQYFELYRQMEISEFEDEMTNKAQTSAENNVRKFLDQPREKSLWDRISTVSHFTRDREDLTVYSPLDGWARDARRV